MLSLKKSKFKSLTNNEISAQDLDEVSNQLFEVKIFSNFETKADHFSPNKPQDPKIFSFIPQHTNPNAMEIEPEPHQNELQPQVVIPDQDVFKQQEEKLFKRHDLKVKTTNLSNQFQQEFMEINSEAKIPKKKSKEGDMIIHEFRHLVFSPQCSELVFKRHLTIIYRGLIYARKCLKGPSDNYLKSKQIDLVSRIPNLSKELRVYLEFNKIVAKLPRTRR